MLSTKKILAVFIPALAVVAIALFVRVIQYEPLFPKLEDIDSNTTNQLVIPIFPKDPILGEAKSPTTIIAFEDFACPSCEDQSTILKNLQEKHPGKFKIIWKGLPVTEFPYNSQPAHLYSYCANEQDKFNEFSDLAFINSGNLSTSVLDSIATELGLDNKEFHTCLDSIEATNYIENTKQIARLLNIQAVPAFFINNNQVSDVETDYEWELELGL